MQYSVEKPVREQWSTAIQQLYIKWIPQNYANTDVCLHLSNVSVALTKSCVQSTDPKKTRTPKKHYTPYETVEKTVLFTKNIFPEKRKKNFPDFFHNIVKFMGKKGHECYLPEKCISPTKLKVGTNANFSAAKTLV